MIAALSRRARRVVAGDRRDLGVSLVELLIAMVIFSILLAMTVGFFVSASRATVLDKQVDGTTRSASIGIDEMARVIRGAVPVPVANQQTPTSPFSAGGPTTSSAGSNSLTVFSSLDLTGSAAQTIQVQFSVVGTNLVEKTWQPIVTNGYTTFATNPTSTRILAGPVVLPASGGPNLFSYVDTNNATIAMTSGLVPVASVPSIAAVQVSLQVGTSASGSQSTLLTNLVGLPNLNIARSPTP